MTLATEKFGAGAVRAEKLGTNRRSLCWGQQLEPSKPATSGRFWLSYRTPPTNRTCQPWNPKQRQQILHLSPRAHLEHMTTNFSVLGHLSEPKTPATNCSFSPGGYLEHRTPETTRKTFAVCTTSNPKHRKPIHLRAGAPGHRQQVAHFTSLPWGAPWSTGHRQQIFIVALGQLEP